MDKYYGYIIHGKHYFIKTDKKKANDKDAKKILDLFLRMENKNIEDYNDLIRARNR